MDVNRDLGKEFSDSEEPSVLSADPNERKLARRLRIQRRMDALHKLRDDESPEIQEESITQKQIIASSELLEKIISEGNEVITNIRVANDAREIERRKEANNIRRKLLKLLEENAHECKMRYDLINERWAAILESNDPLDINREMEFQKEKCEEVLAKKDSVIAALKFELQRADDKFFDDQERQKEDIRLLIERIENQMSTMENMYSRELELIEKTLRLERENLVGSFQKKWDALYKQQEEDDRIGDEKRREIMREYEEEMERVMREHDEEFREQKIALEKECQALQQQVEKTKALCMLNSEKLSYNYMVLKSREEENAIIKSQQKRKINRLQGIISNLKKNYAELQENTAQEIDKLTNQILKAHKNIRELEEKSIHFARVNEKQYMDIWNMNTENANELIDRILSVDREIHERCLGILWEPPKKRLPKKEDLPSYRAALDTVLNHRRYKCDKSEDYDCNKLEKSFSEMKLRRQVLSKILKQISDCSGYLIEDKLQELISSRSDEEKTIIRLDNVFQALCISSTDEIDMLLDFFLPYAYCPICTHKEEITQILDRSLSRSSSCTKICEGCNDENVLQLVDSVKKEVGRLSRTPEEASRSDSFSNIGLDRESDKRHLGPYSRKYTCDKGHVLEIQTAYVTKALKEVVTKCNAINHKELLPLEERSIEKSTISRNLSAHDVNTYWSKYREFFDEDKVKLWDAVLIGLNKYYDILKDRNNLCIETESLRKQNAELHRLLEYHTANAEDRLSSLQVRPTKRYY